MSKENRRRMYERLKAEGRLRNTDQELINEFGKEEEKEKKSKRKK